MFCGHDSVRGRVPGFFTSILSEATNDVFRSEYNTQRRPTGKAVVEVFYIEMAIVTIFSDHCTLKESIGELYNIGEL